MAPGIDAEPLPCIFPKSRLDVQGQSKWYLNVIDDNSSLQAEIWVEATEEIDDVLAQEVLSKIDDGFLFLVTNSSFIAAALQWLLKRVLTVGG